MNQCKKHGYVRCPHPECVNPREEPRPLRNPFILASEQDSKSYREQQLIYYRQIGGSNR